MTSGRAFDASAARISGLALAAVLGALLLALPEARASAEDVGACGPFDAGPTGIVQLAADRTLRDPGVQAAAQAGAPADPGSIVPLPGLAADESIEGAAASASDAAATAGAADASAEAEPSEALLALPKNAAGTIPTDFELGPGATIAHSFFSPVICATVARVAGPPGATLDQLVTVVPDTGIVVPNDVYASAADDVVSAEATPVAADPYVPLQYGLAHSGVKDARAFGAGQGVRVALLDSAPDIAHRDLAPSDIVAVETGSPSDAGVHGTLMAGVIAAAENNGYGIAGLAPAAHIVSIPVCVPKGGAGGQCTIYQMLQGFDRAYDAEAVIMNLSLSGPPNPLLERGVARLEELGMVVVAAAGNEGRADRRYPAAYPSVVGVGAVDRDGRLFRSSNRGAWVELHAPGVEVLSTVPGSAFAFGSGTSLAAAHVTGSLAVLTGITGDSKRARSELFRVVNAREGDGLPILPPVCDVLRRTGRVCGAPEERSSPKTREER